MSDLETKLETALSELKTFREKAEEQIADTGTMNSELKEKISELQAQVDAIDAKIAEQHRAPETGESVEDFLKDNSNVQDLMNGKSKAGRIELSAKHVAELEQKTTVTSSAVGSATSGILQIDRVPGIVPEARAPITIRDLLVARPTAMNQIDFVKVNSAMAKASPQTEASAKYENAETFTTATANVRTIATWIPATKQVLDDMDELMNFLRSALMYNVRLEEDNQLLNGDNTGQNLNGLITQAQAFDTSLLVAAGGYTYIDCLARAIQQVQADKEVAPSYAVVHPNDYWSLRLTKDDNKNYILGNPQSRGPFQIFGLTLVPTTNVSSGTFLVGSGSPAVAQIRDRQGLTVDISTEHSDYFTKNMVAIRAELRMTLVVFRPDAQVTGSFTSSPSQ